MSHPKIELYADNTLRVHDLEITREDTGATLDDTDLSSGVSLTIYEKGTDTEILSVDLSHQGDGEWEGTIGADEDLDAGERVDLKYEADGGSQLKGTLWQRNVLVEERPITS